MTEPERITFQVSAGQFAALSLEVMPSGRPHLVHKISVGPFCLPGTWNVVGAQSRTEPPEATYFITLERVS